MIRNTVVPSSRKRATAIVATGALLALGGVLVSASAANAATQTPAPGVNYSVVNPSNPVNRASTPTAPNDKFVLTDGNGKSVQAPAWAVVGDQNTDKVWAKPDANNTSNLTTHYGLFFYIPSTQNLVDVGSHLGGITNAASVAPGPQAAYNATAVTTELESLAPGTEYDVIIGQTPFASGGTAGDPSVLLPNENYYDLPYQYDGLNTTSGVYESGLIGTTVNTAPVANTVTALTAVADSIGGVVLTATVEDATTNVTDTTATGGVTFSAAGLSNVTAQVVNGVATTTIAYPTTKLRDHVLVHGGLLGQRQLRGVHLERAVGDHGRRSGELRSDRQQRNRDNPGPSGRDAHAERCHRWRSVRNGDAGPHPRHLLRNGCTPPRAP